MTEWAVLFYGFCIVHMGIFIALNFWTIHWLAHQLKKLGSKLSRRNQRRLESGWLG